MLPRGDDLGAVEARRAVDAAIADEDYVVPSGEPTRVREVHVGDARAALQAEDGSSRMKCVRPDAGDRKCDQPGVGVVTVLADDERPAVGRLVRVRATLEGQLPGVGA